MYPTRTRTRTSGVLIGLALLGLALLGLAMILAPDPAGAQVPQNPGVCPQGLQADPPGVHPLAHEGENWTGHFVLGTGPTWTAPDLGPTTFYLAYCVKAGSAEQGDGPEVHYFDEPTAGPFTMEHSSGHDLSHVSFLKVEVPPPPPPPPPPPTTTTVPEVTTTTVPDGTTTTTVPDPTTSTTAPGGTTSTTVRTTTPRTGSSDGPLAAAGVALVLGGSAAVAFAERRRRAA